MRPLRIIIFRHGQSFSNIDKSIHNTTPDHLVELTDHGFNQAENLRKDLFGIINYCNCSLWTSSYVRAIQTAKIALGDFIGDDNKLNQSPLIREQDWGNFYDVEKMNRQIRERRTHSYFYYRFENGESPADVYNRIVNFFETQIFTKSCDDVVISSHGITAMVMMMYLCGWNVDQYEIETRFKNCEYVILKRGFDKYEIEYDGRSRESNHK